MIECQVNFVINSILATINGNHNSIEVIFSSSKNSLR